MDAYLCIKNSNSVICDEGCLLRIYLECNLVKGSSSHTKSRWILVSLQHDTGTRLCRSSWRFRLGGVYSNHCLHW